MKQLFRITTGLWLAAFILLPCLAQTINRPGINLGLLGNYDTVIPDNLACVMNCGFEPPDVRSVGLQFLTGTTTLALYQPYYTNGGQPTLPANYLVGYNYRLNNSTATANVGCTATVTASSPYPGESASAITAISVASNGVTLATANTYIAGEVLNLTGLAATYLNNVLFTVTSATSSTVSLTTAGFSHANVATTSDAGIASPQLAITLGSITCPGSAAVSALPSATQAGDKYTLENYQYPTPSSVWASGQGSISNTLSGGAVLTSDIANPIDGVQSLLVDTTASGSTASVFPTFDNSVFAGGTALNRFISLDGTINASIMAQSVSGSAAFTLKLYRGGSVLCSGSFTATSTAATYTIPSCAPTENTTNPAAGMPVTLQFSPISAGVIRIDDFHLNITSNKAAANTSAARDPVVAALQYATGYGDGRTIQPAVTPSTQPAVWSTLRDWTRDERGFAAMNTSALHASPNLSGTPGNESIWYGPQLPDLNALGAQIGAKIYINIPCTWTNAEGVAFIEYEAANWVGAGKTFPEIYLPFCNEDWNTDFPGLVIPSTRPGAYNGVSDYVDRAASLFKAMAADPAYNPAYFHFILNEQYGTTSPYTDTNAAAPVPLLIASGSQFFGIETAQYTQSTVGNWDTEADLWGSALAEAAIDGMATGSNWYGLLPTAALEGLTSCGPAHNEHCAISTYEYGNATGATCGMNGAPACGSSVHSAYIDNQHLQYIQRGAGQALVTATQALGMMNAGYPASNLFGMFGYAAASFLNTAATGGTPEYNSVWGDLIDAGGATSYANRAQWGGYFNPAPPLIGLHLLNKTLLGANNACATGLPTFNFAGDTSNGPIPAASNVPQVLINCTKDTHGNVGIFMVNNDQTASHTVPIPSAYAMIGTVSVEAFAPSSLDLLNEAQYGTDTQNFVDQAVPTPTSVTSPASYVLPAHSMVALLGTSVPAATVTTNHQTYGSPSKSGQFQTY